MMLRPKVYPMLMAALALTTIAFTTMVAAVPLQAQNTDITYVPPGPPASIYTPEIQLGSATQPAVVTMPPIVEQIPGEAPAPAVSNATPASTELLASRHFDYIVSPLDAPRPGSIADTSISLGDYARQLRAEKQNAPTPNSMAKPIAPW
jgi:hypothetical protein